MKITIGLIDVGENLNIDLDRLARKLNKLQSSFEFSHENAVPLSSLGDPDEDLQWYHFEHIFKVLSSHPQVSKLDYLAGITHVRTTRQMRDEGDNINKDYFSFSDKKKLIAISLNQNVTIFNSQSKNLDQYTIFCLMSELLCIMAKKSLYHKTNEDCLFDECVDRATFATGINESRICVGCMARLKERGIGNKQINDTRKILEWCRRNIGKASWYGRTIRNPLTCLFFGA